MTSKCKRIIDWVMTSQIQIVWARLILFNLGTTPKLILLFTVRGLSVQPSLSKTLSRWSSVGRASHKKWPYCRGFESRSCMRRHEKILALMSFGQNNEIIAEFVTHKNYLLIQVQVNWLGYFQTQAWRHFDDGWSSQKLFLKFWVNKLNWILYHRYKFRRWPRALCWPKNDTFSKLPLKSNSSNGTS